MPWVKIDEGFPEHEKVLGLSDGAFRVYVTALCYAGRNLTDGRIPAVAVRMLGGARRMNELVAAGLLEREGDDYRIHDYLEYNPSREKVEGERRRARERMANARGSSREQPENCDGSSPNPIRSDPNPIPTDPEGGALSPPPARPKRPRATVVDDAFRAQMVERFADTWEPARVNEIIDAALGHKAAAKWIDKQAGVRNWLSNEQERKRERTPREPNGRPKGMPAPYSEVSA